jgi:hypothetical protein
VVVVGVVVAVVAGEVVAEDEAETQVPQVPRVLPPEQPAPLVPRVQQVLPRMRRRLFQQRLRPRRITTRLPEKQSVISARIS